MEVPRGDLAEHVNGNVGGVPGGQVKGIGQVLSLKAGGGLPGQHHLHRARAAGDAPEVALVLQGGELV